MSKWNDDNIQYVYMLTDIPPFLRIRQYSSFDTM